MKITPILVTPVLVAVAGTTLADKMYHRSPAWWEDRIETVCELSPKLPLYNERSNEYVHPALSGGALIIAAGPPDSTVTACRWEEDRDTGAPDYRAWGCETFDLYGLRDPISFAMPQYDYVSQSPVKITFSDPRGGWAWIDVCNTGPNLIFGHDL